MPNFNDDSPRFTVEAKSLKTEVPNLNVEVKNVIVEAKRVNRHASNIIIFNKLGQVRPVFMDAHEKPLPDDREGVGWGRCGENQALATALAGAGWAELAF